MTDQELINRVAEKVMGWIDRGGFYAKPESLSKIEFTKETTSYGKAWNPLTDANHWMMVVEKVTSKVFAGYNMHYSLGWWRVSFYISANQIFEKCSDVSIGYAVCLAALEALEGKMTQQWTKTPPTESGYWWIYNPNIKMLGMCRISYTFDFEVFFPGEIMRYSLNQLSDCYWLGPIAPPEPPKED